eukprot:scaffold266731_cov35-Prasinocladus_malaysianus.AAC.1
MLHSQKAPRPMDHTYTALTTRTHHCSWRPKPDLVDRTCKLYFHRTKNLSTTTTEVKRLRPFGLRLKFDATGRRPFVPKA